MKARIIIDGASLGPDDLKRAREAFDGAWTAIAGRTQHRSPRRRSAKLARIVLSLVPDTKDAAEIQSIAVQEMTKGVSAYHPAKGARATWRQRFALA
jgi:hypothetical protein